MNRQLMRRGLLFVGLVLLIVLAPLSTALAYEGRGGETVVIDVDEVIDDDLYVSANTVLINGTVKGDVYAVGSTVTVNGTVEDDLVAGGQAVTVNGTVGDDVRAAGAAMVLGTRAEVGGDVIAVGGSLEAQDGSAVEGDLLFTGYQALLAGTVGGNVSVDCNGLELQGTVGGDVEGAVGAKEATAPISPFQFIPGMPRVPVVPGGLTIGDSAQIGGSLVYTAPQEAGFASQVVEGEVEYTEQIVETTQAQPTPGRGVLRWFLRNARRFVVLLAIGLLLVWLVPGVLGRPADEMASKPWPSLGLGAATYFGLPVAVGAVAIGVILLTLLLRLLTLSGLSSAVFWVGTAVLLVLVVAFALAVAYFTKLVVAYWGGRLLLGLAQREGAPNRFWSMVIGVAIVAALLAVPLVGWMVGVVIALFGLGALWLLLPKKPPAAEGEPMVAKVEA